MFRVGLFIFLIGLFTAPVCVPVLHAQTKTTKKPTVPKKDTTVIYVEEKKVPTPAPVSNPRSDMKETVIVIRPADTAPKYVPTYKDTVIIIKKGPGKEKMAAMKKAEAMEELKGNNFCNCVKMDIKVAPVLEYETYLNYDFIFKNECKVDVWISSRHFRFTPYNTFEAPVKVLRKLSFVKKYGAPDFVKIMPGETYTFTNSDDAFFEYDLKQGQNYKFVFEHRNFGDKSRMAPERTYLCGQKRTQVITVK